MPWFNVDDGFAFHRKTVRAGNAATGLWVRAGSWCAKELTDGFVPDHMVPTMGTVKQAERLVMAGLWVRDDEREGFQFHEYAEDGRNLTREVVLKKREQAAEKKRKQREGNGAKSANAQAEESCPEGTDGGVPGGVPGGVNASPPLPSPPSSPNGEEPSLRSGGARKRAAPARKATRIPDDFTADADMIEWARANTPSVGRTETALFVDYWKQATRNAEKRDWRAAWQVWMRKEQKRIDEQRPTAPGRPTSGSKRVDKSLAALHPDDPFLTEYAAAQRDATTTHDFLVIEGGRIA